MKNGLLIIFLFLLLGAIGVYFYGNKTQIEYYANGKIKSETSRAIFKKNGPYREYYEDGMIKLSVYYVNNQKSGKQIRFLTDGNKIETIYKNDVISGTETYFNSANEKIRIISYANGKKKGIVKLFDTEGKTVEFFILSGMLDGHFSFLQQFNGMIASNKVTIKSPEKSSVIYDISAQIICKEDELIDSISAYIQNKNAKTLEKLLSCFSLTEATWETDLYRLSFKGNLIYPKFSKDSVLTIQLKNKEFPIDIFPFNMAKYDGLIYVTFKKNNKEIVIQYLNENNKRLLEALVVGKEDVLSGLTTFVQKNLWQDSESNIGPVENLTLTNLQIFDIQQKLIAHFSGEFNLYNAFYSPSQFEILNADKKPWVRLKTDVNSLNMTLLYPLSLRPFLSAKVVITDDFKNVYHTVMDSVKHLDELGVMDEIQNNSTRVTAGLMMKDLFVYNEQGQKVLEMDLNWKLNTQIYNALQHPIDNIMGTVKFYENNNVLTMKVDSNNSLVFQNSNDNLIKTNPTYQSQTADILQRFKEFFQKNTTTTIDPFLYEMEQMLLKENPNGIITHEFIDLMNYYRAEQIARITKKYGVFLLKYLSEKKQVSNLNSVVSYGASKDIKETNTVPTIWEAGLIDNINYGQDVKIVYVPNISNPFASNADLTLKLTFINLSVCVQTAQLLDVPDLCRKEDLSFLYTIKQ